MATVTKDFKIKSGLIVEGENATVNGSDIITEDIITGGTQNNITVTYNANTKTLDFAVDALTIDTAGPLFYDTNGSLDVNVGTGLNTDNGALVLDYTGIAGFGLSGLGNTLALDTAAVGNALAGSFLDYDSMNENLKVDAEDLANTITGNGLTFSSSGGRPQISLDVANLAGSYLNAANAFAISVDKAELANDLAGTYLEYDSVGQNLKVDAEDLANTIAGNGLTFSSSTGRPQISLDVMNLAGTYLNATSGFTIAVDKTELANALAGSYLEYEGVSDALKVDLPGIASDIAGFGLEVDPMSMFGNQIRVKTDSLAGRFLTVNSGNGLAVDANALAGNGLQYDSMANAGYGALSLNSDALTGTGIMKDPMASVRLQIDANAIAGAGLTASNTSTLAVDVGYVANALADGGSIVSSGNTLSVNVDLLAGDGLAVDIMTSSFVVDTNVIATRSYVDNAISGLDWKSAVNLLSTTNVDISGEMAGIVIDGHAPFDGFDNHYRILLTGQTDATENGIYYLQWDGGASNAGIVALRATDADAVAELRGAAVFVMEGDQYGSTSWVQNNHYANSFDDLVWTQFSGQGSYTAGNGITLDGNQFSINDNVVVTHTDLDGFLNSTSGSEGTTILYVQDYVATAIETGDATATPTYLAIDYNSIAKQVASEFSMFGYGSPEVVYSFDKTDYRSAKFLVQMQGLSHTQVSEVLLTLDSSGNVAITEYAIVGTNGNLGDVSADVSGNDVQLTVSSTNGLYVRVAGTLLA